MGIYVLALGCDLCMHQISFNNTSANLASANRITRKDQFVGMGVGRYGKQMC